MNSLNHLLDYRNPESCLLSIFDCIVIKARCRGKTPVLTFNLPSLERTCWVGLSPWTIQWAVRPKQFPKNTTSSKDSESLPICRCVSSTSKPQPLESTTLTAPKSAPAATKSSSRPWNTRKPMTKQLRGWTSPWAFISALSSWCSSDCSLWLSSQAYTQSSRFPMAALEAKYTVIISTVFPSLRSVLFILGFLYLSTQPLLSFCTY